MHARNVFLFSLILLGAAPLVRGQAVVANPPLSFKVESGFTYSRGDYGLPQDTTVWVVPFSLSYESGPWVLRATLPWVTIDGPATVIGDVGGAGPGGVPRPSSGRSSGLGDSVLSLTYKMNPGADRLNLDLTGRVKFPTGDDARGIGTGATDYYAQLDLYRTFGTVTPFGSVGYRWLGDGRYQLHDGLFVSGGLLFTVMPGTSVGFAYEWRDRLVAGGDQASEASVLLFRRLDEHWSVNASAMKGFTDASANYGFSAGFSYAF